MWRRTVQLMVGTAWCAALGLTACGPEETDEAPPAPPIEQRIPPQLLVDSPARSSFVLTDDVLVSGTVLAGSAPLTRLRIAGGEVPIGPDGRFEWLWPVAPGPNIIDLRAEAEDGGRTVDALSIFGGPVRAPGEVIHDAAGLHLGPTFLDDDEPDLDDAAGIFEALLEDEQLLAKLTEEPFVAGDKTIDISSVEVSQATVDIAAQPGCLRTHVTLGEPWATAGGYVELRFLTTGWLELLGDEVILYAHRAVLDVDLCPSVTPAGDLEVEAQSPQVTFYDFLISTDSYPNLGDYFPGTNASLRDTLEEAMVEWIGESLGDMIGGLLSAYELDYTTVGPPAVTTSFAIEQIVVDFDGVDLTLGGSFSAPVGLAAPPAGAGSLRTDDPPLGTGFSNAPVALALSDDAFNQLIFAFWWGGGAQVSAVPAIPAGTLPEVFDPLSSLEVALELPPTLLRSTEPEYPFDLAAGGVSAALLAGTDRFFDLGVHVRAGVDIAVDSQGLIDLIVDDRAQRITVQANVAASPSYLDRGDVAALVRMMTPTLLSEAQVLYEGFPIPALELSTFSQDSTVFQGKAVTFEPSGLSKVGIGGGYVLVEGQVVETTVP
ncbi:MAG: hypothetical protein JRI23_31510 [Deltaproteobacteria bacterium]|jgi:hypothetical protein|nr:hypothetical protein [Deltaproteobacteria bacterium]MBW2536744.1 hypothetical protein [Deltaproteobacteria bacterium]